MFLRVYISIIDSISRSEVFDANFRCVFVSEQIRTLLAAMTSDSVKCKKLHIACVINVVVVVVLNRCARACLPGD